MPDIYSVPSKPPPGTQMNHGLAICRGLVGAWPLNDGVGLIAHNAVPGGPDGQLGSGPTAATLPQTPQWVGNDWGSCLLFPRSNAGLFVNIPLATGIASVAAGQWVFSCMIFCTSYANVNAPCALSGGTSLSNTPCFQLGMEGNNQLFMFARDDAAHSVNPLGEGNINDGRRHSLAMVADGSTIYGYLDGVLNKTGSIAALGQTTLDRLTIGNTAQKTQSEQWRGVIDQALMWNRVLSRDEILILHRAPFGYLRAWNT